MRSFPEIRRALVLSFRQRPGLSILALVAIPFSAIGLLLIAFGQRALLDGAAEADSRLALVASLVAAAGFAVHGSVSRVAGNLQFYLGSEVAQDLSAEAFRLVNRRRRYETLLQSAYSDSLERLHHGTFWLGALGWVMLSIVVQTAAFTASFTALLFIHPFLPLLVVAAILPALLAARGRQRVRAVEDVMLSSQRQERALHEMCTQAENIKETRVSGAVPALDSLASDRWQTQNSHRVAAAAPACLWESLSWAAFGAVLTSGVILVSGSVDENTQRVGNIILLIALAVGLRNQVGASVSELSIASEGFAGADAMGSVRAASLPLSSATECPAPSAVKRGIILENVSYTYEGSDRAAINDLTLTIPPGVVVAIVGPNGAGKSTLIDLLTGVLSPSQGRVTLDNVNLSTLVRLSPTQPVSGTFQDFMKTHFSLRENVGLGHLPSAVSTEKIEAALARAGAETIVEKMPAGIDTLFSAAQTSNAVDLSHGEWQRVAIARGYLNPRPLILAMDEPTSALDPSTEHEFFRSATDGARRRGAEYGGITLIVSHRFSSALHADLVLVLENSTVATIGTHDELRVTSEIYRAMLADRRGAYGTEQQE